MANSYDIDILPNRYANRESTVTPKKTDSPIHSGNLAFFELYCFRHRFLATNLVQAYLLDKSYMEIPRESIKGR